ncbi:signal peptidase I [Microbacterium sp. ACRRU]|uniref:signal peptidase I n=1 Tax=Microbacterium sp. ACRRU TaxID=2918204 RepID=UPI001EF6B2D2|nr:signal peptidase I [Microbacterium sp. ACRRU]MCG7418039.1 signal peptidase I [Microbacterium sp. ACRRU]
MTATTDTARRPTRGQRLRRSPLTHLALALVTLALVQTFVIKPFQVPSESMSPTLENGDRILASRIAYAVSDPGTDDIVVFARPDSWGVPPARSPLRIAIGWVGDIVGIGPSNQDALVKRIIGEPGSTVQCCSADGRIEVDGKPVAEGYIVSDLPFTPGVNDCGTTPASARCFPLITVPEDSYLVMGDNRANSSDSVIACRGDSGLFGDCARFVPRSAIIAKVMSIVWPFNRLRMFADAE